MNNKYYDINKNFIYRFIKYKEYIIKISFEYYYEIYDDKKFFDKNNAEFRGKIEFSVVSIEHIATKLPLTELLVDFYKDFCTIEINKKYEKKIIYYATYERAFLQNFIEEKQYLLFDNYSGVFTDYYSNGTIKETYFHTNGVINGVYKSYYKNIINNDSKIFIECNYLNGKKHGIYKKYFYNGNINIQSFYTNDKLNDDYYVYNQYNLLTYHAKYDNGNIISYNIHNNVDILNFI